MFPKDEQGNVIYSDTHPLDTYKVLVLLQCLFGSPLSCLECPIFKAYMYFVGVGEMRGRGLGERYRPLEFQQRAGAKHPGQLQN